MINIHVSNSHSDSDDIDRSSIRARRNWSILRQKIRDMKHEANWLVLFLDDKRDLARQNIKGLEVDELKNDDHSHALHNVKNDPSK